MNSVNNIPSDIKSKMASYGPFNSFNEMIEELKKIKDETLDETTQQKWTNYIFNNKITFNFRKANLLNHPYKDALFSVLCELKEKTCKL